LEIPADYLSRNVVEAIRMSDGDLAENQNTDPLCITVKIILKNEPIQQIYKRKILKPAEKLENELLWTRIIGHGEKKTVLMVPENMVTTLSKGIHGDMLYSQEGQFKTKERILQSYGWRGMDQGYHQIFG
jgi:hypothetical protein